MDNANAGAGRCRKTKADWACFPPRSLQAWRAFDKHVCARSSTPRAFINARSAGPRRMTCWVSFLSSFNRRAWVFLALVRRANQPVAAFCEAWCCGLSMCRGLGWGYAYGVGAGSNWGENLALRRSGDCLHLAWAGSRSGLCRAGAGGHALFPEPPAAVSNVLGKSWPDTALLVRPDLGQCHSPPYLTHVFRVSRLAMPESFHANHIHAEH